MPRKRFSAEQIVVLLRQIEVLMSRLWRAEKPGYRSSFVTSV
jgi:hypothetical protein